MKNVLMTGAYSGLGKSIAEYYYKLSNDIKVYNFDEKYEFTEVPRSLDYRDRKVINFNIDDDVQGFNIETIIDCGFRDKQQYVNEDPFGSDMVQSMKDNVAKLYFLDKHFHDSLIKNQGIFIGIGSNASYMPMTASSNYCMNKAAYEMWFKVRAREEDRLQGKFQSIYGDYVSYICINPILIDDTPMPTNLMYETMVKRGWSYDETYKDYHKHCHNGISLKVEPTAQFIVDLCTHNYSFARTLSGSVLNIGGNL